MTDPPSFHPGSPGWDATRSPAAALQARFEAVAQRMAGLPIVNAALRVQPVGLRRWGDGWLGAVVTPWFLNLVLLPAQPLHPVAGTATGATRGRVFPAGVFDFLVQHDPALGEFESCSLFSPMDAFAAQTDAVATAEAALAALFDARHRVPAEAATAADTAPPTRRAFLTGRTVDG